MTLLAGVTGGIGSGKTTVLNIVRRLGQRTLESDAVVDELYEPGSRVYRTIEKRWGADILSSDGTVDKAAVARRVFDAPSELQWLNSVIHPEVRSRIRREAAAAPGPLFCEIPLLFEAGWESDMTYTVAVWCHPTLRHQRLKRRGWSTADIRQREKNQLPPENKLERADFAIINNAENGEDLLRRQLKRLLERLNGSR